MITLCGLAGNTGTPVAVMYLRAVIDIMHEIHLLIEVRTGCALCMGSRRASSFGAILERRG